LIFPLQTFSPTASQYADNNCHQTATAFKKKKEKNISAFQWKKTPWLQAFPSFAFGTPNGGHFSPLKRPLNDYSTGACVPRFQRCSFFEGKKGTILASSYPIVFQNPPNTL